MVVRNDAQFILHLMVGGECATSQRGVRFLLVVRRTTSICAGLNTGLSLSVAVLPPHEDVTSMVWGAELGDNCRRCPRCRETEQLLTEATPQRRRDGTHPTAGPATVDPSDLRRAGPARWSGSLGQLPGPEWTRRFAVPRSGYESLSGNGITRWSVPPSTCASCWGHPARHQVGTTTASRGCDLNTSEWWGRAKCSEPGVQACERCSSRDLGAVRIGRRSEMSRSNSVEQERVNHDERGF